MIDQTNPDPETIMREALRHLTADTTPLGGEITIESRYAQEAADILAAALAARACLHFVRTGRMNPYLTAWDGDGYRDVIGNHRQIRGLFHKSGVYSARASGNWFQCYGHADRRAQCPGCKCAAEHGF